MNTQKEIGLWRSRSSSNLQVIVLLLNFLRWIDSLFYLHIIHRFIHTNKRAHFQFTYLLLFFVERHFPGKIIVHLASKKNVLSMSKAKSPEMKMF